MQGLAPSTVAIVFASSLFGVGLVWAVLWSAFSLLPIVRNLPTGARASILVAGTLLLPALAALAIFRRILPSAAESLPEPAPLPPPPAPAPREEQPTESEPARHNVALIRTLIDNLPEGIVLLGGDGEVLLSNLPGQEYLTEYGTFVADLHLAIFGGIPVEQLVKPPSDNWRWEIIVRQPYHQILEICGQQFAIDDQVSGAVIVIRDVTAEKQQRDRLERSDRLAAVGQLAAGISHDFKNILQGINLCAEMSRSQGISPVKLSDNMLTIVEQSARGSKLIQQIMDFTRQSESTQRVQEIGDLVSTTNNLLSPGIPDNIYMEVVIAGDNLQVMADSAQIQQILTNLVFNARDAMPDGGTIKIVVSEVGTAGDSGPIPPEVGSGDWLRLSVADTGIGIPPTLQRRVFEPFFTTKPAGRGNGLGLAQVYGNVRQHGGHVDFETAVGVGTVFSVFLPLYRYHQQQSAEELTDPISARGNGELVLVVEDDLAVLTATAQSLRLLGYTVLEAVDGSDALRMIELEEHVDLLLTDARMPGMGGLTLVNEVRRLRPETKVMMMSAHAAATIEGLEDSSAIHALLAKPFSIDELGEQVHRALAGSPTESTHGGAA